MFAVPKDFEKWVVYWPDDDPEGREGYKGLKKGAPEDVVKAFKEMKKAEENMIDI